MLKNYKPVFDATVKEKLEKAGFSITGNFNIDDFETMEISLALACDTGGEIRQACLSRGLTGIKPTYGAVSRYGLFGGASSLGQIGPIGKNIEDCAALLTVISGPDSKDSTCVIEEPFNFSETVPGGSLPEKTEGLKIGLPENLFDTSIGENNNPFLAAVKVFEEAGAKTEKFDLPLTDYLIPTYNIIASAEASSNFTCFDGLKYGYRSGSAKSLSDVYMLSRSEGFEYEEKKKIMLGSLFLSSECYNVYFKKAMQVRTLIIDAYRSLFERFDMILSPVGDICNIIANLAGLPAAVLPCGIDKNGAATAFQLMGKAFSENKLVNAARIYQSRTDHHMKKTGTENTKPGGEAS